MKHSGSSCSVTLVRLKHAIEAYASVQYAHYHDLVHNTLLPLRNHYITRIPNSQTSDKMNWMVCIYLCHITPTNIGFESAPL